MPKPSLPKALVSRGLVCIEQEGKTIAMIGLVALLQDASQRITDDKTIKERVALWAKRLNVPIERVRIERRPTPY